jgi:TldD protein
LRNAAVVAAAQLPQRLPQSHSLLRDPASRAVIVQAAVDAAREAGAQYADARITHTIAQTLGFLNLGQGKTTVGIGIRALVNGAWGFTAAPSGDVTAVARLAQEAVMQAKVNARGERGTVELDTTPPAVGEWTMPVRIDPFSVSDEEKLSFIQYWMNCAQQIGLSIDSVSSELHFIRQERVIATSEGAHFSQVVYESGGKILVEKTMGEGIFLEGLTSSGKGWELALDADISNQIRSAPERIAAQKAAKKNPKPIQVGRYTLVCDGATIAALLHRTIGIATQLDRAMGYEANASGTSFLNDPSNMLGSYKLGSPLVTVSANRSMAGQLATVKWDDEGVEPQPFTLVKNGILVDYQTTREQAAWLAPYYQRTGQTVQSHGCAAAENARCITMQNMPNLQLTPAGTTAQLDDLIANVKDGILIADGRTTVDFQARTGLLGGTMHEIKNGKVGRPLEGGAVLFDTVDFWRNVANVGDSSTQTIVPFTMYPYTAMVYRFTDWYPVKGEPPQGTSYSVQAGAATITKQAIIDPRRKA